MDRKGIIAIALAIVTLVGWTVYNQRQIEKARAAHRVAVAEAEKAKPAAPAATPAPAAMPAVPAIPAVAEAAPAVEEKTETLSNGKVDYTFSNLGGGIARAVLQTHEAERGHKIVITNSAPRRSAP